MLLLSAGFAALRLSRRRNVARGSPGLHPPATHEPGPGTRWFITQQHGLNRVYEILGDHDPR